MRRNNEHILRRRVQRQVGRPIGNTIWTWAHELGFVTEALEVEGGDQGLVEFVAQALRVRDSGLRAAAQRAARGNPLGASPGTHAARIEAISRLAALEAASDEEILSFRERVLQRHSPLTPDEAEAYLENEQARGQPTKEFTGPMELLKYQNRRISQDVHVWPGSPLDRLRMLADSLSESFPWQPAQAAAFVLEGVVPLATPFMLRLQQPWHETRPRRSKVILEIDLWVPAAQVARAYRRLQRQVLSGHNRPISQRSIDLVNFVLTHRPESWPALLKAWNKEHPEGGYSNYRSFRYAFARASRSLLQPDYHLHVPS